MINGDLPPSSSVTGFRLLRAANSSTTLPVSVDPVKASCRRAAGFHKVFGANVAKSWKFHTLFISYKTIQMTLACELR